MNTNKILLAGLIGGVVAFFLGFLFYGVICSEFFASNMGSATGVMRGDDEMQWIPMIVGHIAYGLLFAIIYGRWASISTFATGAKAGAVIGLLVALAHGMIQLGSTHLSTMMGTLADVGVATLLSAGTGGVVGWFLGRGQ
ncbi:MAG: hypothetical protein H6574_11905 [Lewinellaceae bacterium]|nr:hypothetical protein [Saprospiraceae bacterium]MCB9331781.1 hypothetical protein [Lewinellaceae bacterium]